MFNNRFCLFVYLITFSFISIAMEEVTLYGNDDYPPYSFVQDGVFKGIYVDFLKQAASSMLPDYKVEIMPTPWKRGLLDLETGTHLAFFPPHLKKSRMYIEPYSISLNKEVVVLFCTEAVMKIKPKIFPADFADLRIGVNQGFSLSDNVVVARSSGLIKVEEGHGIEASFKKIIDGTIDCYINDRSSILYALKTLKNVHTFDSLKIFEAAELSSEEAYIGYSKQSKLPYKQDFINKFNKQIETLKKTGAIEKIQANYIN